MYGFILVGEVNMRFNGSVYSYEIQTDISLWISLAYFLQGAHSNSKKTTFSGKSCSDRWNVRILQVEVLELDLKTISHLGDAKMSAAKLLSLFFVKPTRI